MLSARAAKELGGADASSFHIVVPLLDPSNCFIKILTLPFQKAASASSRASAGVFPCQCQPQHFQHILYPNAHAANAGIPPTLLRFKADPLQGVGFAHGFMFSDKHEALAANFANHLSQTNLARRVGRQFRELR